MEDTVGIDISKDKPDAYRLSKREHKQVCNDKNGAKALALWANKAGVSCVIFESTGVHHRCIETGLAHHEITFSRVNPRQARRFCEGAGLLAKTDRVDAAMLAKTGSLSQLKADAETRKTLHDLKQLATARQALIKNRTAAKARPATTPHRSLTRQIKRRLSQIERGLSRIADLVDMIIAADEELRAKADILVSIPGIAKVTACAPLTDMPELEKLSGKQAAKLAGLAPVSRQSGKWQGKEHIQGGRASVRRAVYLPAVVATRCNPDPRARYEQLVSTGKCKKLAITAVMRKLIVMENALLRGGRKWNEYPALPIRILSDCKQMTAGQWTASRASLTLSTRPILRPTVQTCIVLLVRCRGFRGPTGATVPSNSLNVCGWKDSKVVAKDLKRIYQATDDVEAEKALADFEVEWCQKYTSIAHS